MCQGNIKFVFVGDRMISTCLRVCEGDTKVVYVGGRISSCVI